MIESIVMKSLIRVLYRSLFGVNDMFITCVCFNLPPTPGVVVTHLCDGGGSQCDTGCRQ